MPTLAPIAGCTLVTLAPAPCAPTWPLDPDWPAPLAGSTRGATPRTDPPFTASHWVSRAGMPNRGGGILPTMFTAEYKGHTYISYQGIWGNVGGGPVPLNVHVGSISRTADGVAWDTVFVGDYGGVGWTLDALQKPGLLWVQDETLYCLVNKGSWSWIFRGYVGPGEVAIWKTTNGLTWTKHQVLAAWTAHGSGAGGDWSSMTVGGHAVWRAAGSGPSGEPADWLVCSYEVYANDPADPVYQRGTLQFRSLDEGATWVPIRDLWGAGFGNNAWRGTVFAVPRPGVATDRAVMLGNAVPVRTDDAWATWTGVSLGTGTSPEGGFIVPSGGGVGTRDGGATTGPGYWLSCDYFQSLFPGSPAPPTGLAGSMLAVVPLHAAGGEELLAATWGTAGGVAIWHSTDGGESWADRGAVPVGFSVHYGLARAPTGRLLLYVTGGGGAAMDLWTCDDAPLDVATPRTVCPFTVPVPGAPLGQIAGCASLTFITELCGALAAPPLGPGVATCEAPLGLFELGATCLGAPALVPVQSTRARSHPHAR